MERQKAQNRTERESKAPVPRLSTAATGAGAAIRGATIATGTCASSAGRRHAFVALSARWRSRARTTSLAT